MLPKAYFREVLPRPEYFNEFTGIVVAWQKCGKKKYSSFYMEDRESCTTVYPVRDVIDFLDDPNDALTQPFQLFSEFDNALDVLNRGKVWNGPYQVSLDKWIIK